MMRSVANEHSSGQAIMHSAPSESARLMLIFSLLKMLPHSGIVSTIEIAWVVSMNVKSPRLQPRASVTGRT